MKAFLPHQPVTNTGLRASKELLEVLQIALRSQQATEAQIAEVIDAVTAPGLGYSGFWVNDAGDLILSFAGAIPKISIDGDDLVIVHTDAPPPLSIDATGSVILEM